MKSKKYFSSRVEVDNETGCWNWKLNTSDTGYGRCKDEGKMRKTHRVAYETYKTLIPKNLVVRHMCHNRLCCNPEHLKLGTSKQNAQDRVNRLIS